MNKYHLATRIKFFCGDYFGRHIINPHDYTVEQCALCFADFIFWKTGQLDSWGKFYAKQVCVAHNISEEDFGEMMSDLMYNPDLHKLFSGGENRIR